MVLQSLIGFIYGVIQQTWVVSAIVLKYVLVLQLFYAFRKEGSLLENFSAEVEEYSRELVSVLVILGVLVYIAGFELSVMAQNFSYIVALIYFSYLFWHF